jgi:ABC-type transporter Mla subunit MlaD
LPHNPREKITVVLELDKSTQDIVKKDSVASIETEGLLGNEYVAVSFGSDGQADVANGDTIASVPPLEMGAILKQASGILDSSQEAVKNVTAATAHLNDVSAKIDSGQGTVGALVNDKQLYNNLEQTTASMQTTMQQAQVGVTAFDENMEAMKHNFLLSGFFKKRGYDDEAALGANRISGLPQAAPVKTFTFTGKDLFDKHDSAKLKHEKRLNDAGKFLADNEFGLAVVEVSTGKEGDEKKDQTLTEARAMVVRQYLVDHYGFDDADVKTLGEGKKASADSNAEDWGSVKILIFPQGTDKPADAPASTGSASDGDKQALPATAPSPKS